MAASNEACGKRKHDDVNGGPSSSKKPTFAWNKGLLASMEDKDLQEYSDDRIVIIKDKYPKAKHHFLIMPKENIPNLKSLKTEHLELLEHLHEMGHELINRTDKDLQFRLGYHAVPSMSSCITQEITYVRLVEMCATPGDGYDAIVCILHLHLHVISQDFDSPCLKNKKHWNSFTTDYFFDSEDIIKMLKDTGSVRLDTSRFQDMLKRNLRCHVCKKDFSTMPALKTHIKVHNYQNKS